ncbi:hypothetical protein [Tissierella sp.]|nr:hypothetical protein [Tissierella sp.]MDR7855079.1 hypothetical protein [Tissierella sp.]
MIKKLVVILGIFLSLIFVLSAKVNVKYLVEEDNIKIIKWHAYKVCKDA